MRGWRPIEFHTYLANLLVDVVEARDLDQPSNVIVRQPVREKPSSQLVPLALSPAVDAQPEFKSIHVSKYVG